MSVAEPTASRRAVSRRSRLRASRAGGRDSSGDHTSSDETQKREDSAGTSNTTGDKEKSPPGDDVQRTETPRRTCQVVIAVRERWATSGYSALRRLECRCNDGIVVIRGAVPSYYFKQMAQESIRSVEGVERIVNELSVHDRNATEDQHS